VLSIRLTTDTGLGALTDYLSWLSALIDVTVVDGSRASLYLNHRLKWSAFTRHLAPEPWPGRNKKVAAVMTGVRHARHDKVILADDDVRYDEESLARLVRMLDAAVIVRPQNYFRPLPWHAHWDTARTLINRSFGADYPGTLGLRAAALLHAGGYDGDVLFENLELIRTIRAAGGTETIATDLFVARTPATFGHFLDQRVRQAYDDFAQPCRLAIELALLPLILVALRHARLACAILIAAWAAAELGRRKSNGRQVFSATSALFAPLWVTERAICVWVAVWLRVTGGVQYAGQKLVRAGSSEAAIRRRLMNKKRMVPDVRE
jgi:hypothetical protein